MKKSRSRGSILGIIRSNIIFILLFAAILGIFTKGLSSAAMAEGKEALRIAEESIRRGVVSCYAIEGRYPATYDYLKDNYDVRVDEDKYKIIYEIFADNIMPQITILER